MINKGRKYMFSEISDNYFSGKGSSICSSFSFHWFSLWFTGMADYSAGFLFLFSFFTITCFRVVINCFVSISKSPRFLCVPFSVLSTCHLVVSSIFIIHSRSIFLSLWWLVSYFLCFVVSFSSKVIKRFISFSTQPTFDILLRFIDFCLNIIATYGVILGCNLL